MDYSTPWLPCPSPSPKACSNSCIWKESVTTSNSFCLQSFHHQEIHQLFSSESALSIRWPKYWSFSFSISPSNKYSGLTSFRIDWFDLLAVQEILKSLLGHHSSKASILWHSGFFTVQLKHPSMTTEKPVFTTQIFVGKVKCLLFNMLSRLVIAFLPRSKCLLISWLPSTSAVIFRAPKRKVCHCLYFFPIYLPWTDGTRCHDLSFLNVVLSQLFHSPLSSSSRGSLVPLHFLLWGWCHLHIWGYWCLSWQSRF